MFSVVKCTSMLPANFPFFIYNLLIYKEIPMKISMYTFEIYSVFIQFFYLTTTQKEIENFYHSHIIKENLFHIYFYYFQIVCGNKSNAAGRSVIYKYKNQNTEK